MAWLGNLLMMMVNAKWLFSPKLGYKATGQRYKPADAVRTLLRCPRASCATMTPLPVAALVLMQLA
jgi:hypothetical protein